MLKEFIIGLQPSPVTLTDNSELKELILVTERTSKIEIVCAEIDGDEIVSAILFNEGDIDFRVRDSPASTRDDFLDDLLEVPDYLKTDPNVAGRSLDLKTPFVKRMSMQQTCYSAPDQPHLYWRRISYLRIEGYDGRMIEVGKLRQTSYSIGGAFAVLPDENVEGPCMITGVGMHNADLISLQIISGDNRLVKKPSQIAEHLYAYGKSSVGLVKLKIEGNKVIEGAGFVGMEVGDPDVMEIITKLYEFMASWYSSRSSIHRMFPDLYSLIDYSITENDRNIIFSTFRLERHMRYRIQNQKEGHSFDRDPFIRIKLFQVVSCLASTLERCQRIIVHKPSMNCYCIAYLAGDITNWAIATLVLITQVGLTFVLFLSLWTNESDTEYFELKRESMIVTPIIAIFSAMLVWKQMSNILAIKKAYPGMTSSLMGFYEVIVNGILGVAILIIQVILLTKQDNRLDYVLNSIATIFILELDDTVVFLDDDAITDLHRRMLMKDFQDRVKNIDGAFFEHKMWKTARNFLQINSRTCSIEPLPVVRVTQSIDYEIVKNLEPLNVAFNYKNSSDSSGAWIEMASSAPIFKAKLREDSTVELKFTWHDQGSGNRKGQLRVRLVNVLTDEDVASSPEYGIAPHEETEITESFDLNHGLLRNCAEGYRYIIEVLVGGGGGHEIHVKNFELKSSSCFMKAVEDSVGSITVAESEYMLE